MRVLVALLLLLTPVIGTGSVSARSQKRRNKWYTPITGSFSSLLEKTRPLLQLNSPTHVYHMDDAAARNGMIDALWTDALLGLGSRFSTANPEMTALLTGQTLDHAESAPQFHGLQGQSRFESVVSALFRACHREGHVGSVKTMRFLFC